MHRYALGAQGLTEPLVDRLCVLGSRGVDEARAVALRGKGRDKKGDRFISPAEQIAHASGYCKEAGYAVVVIEPMDLNVSQTTPLDERDGLGEALRRVEAGRPNVITAPRKTVRDPCR